MMNKNSAAFEKKVAPTTGRFLAFKDGTGSAAALPPTNSSDPLTQWRVPKFTVSKGNQKD